MRILYIAPYVPSLIRVRPFNLVRELSRRHEVVVVAVGSAREMGESPRILDYCHSLYTVPLEMHDRAWACMKAVAQQEPLQSAVCRSPELVQRVHGLLRTQRFDVVHVEHLRAAHVSQHLPLGIPTVYDSVDCISLLLERTLQHTHSPLQRFVSLLELNRTRRYETELLRRFHRVTVTAVEDAQALQSLDPTANVRVIRNGVDLEYFKPVARSLESATLVISGKMSYHANVTAVLHFARDIFPRIRASHPNVQLRIAGSNPPHAVQALAQDTSITVTGYVPDMRDELSQATIAVCPVTVKVGIQNKVLEAMAMGKPVVCSRAGAAGLETVEGQDLLVADGPIDFAQQVCRLLDDPARQHQLGSAARKYVESCHRWDVAAREFEALYAEIVNRRARLPVTR